VGPQPRAEEEAVVEEVAEAPGAEGVVLRGAALGAAVRQVAAELV
jgi:hypothetical protein